MSVTSFDIYQYTDWQTCLIDWLAWRKGIERMSLQAFCDRIGGLCTKSHMHRILHTPGRYIGKKFYAPVSKVMGLDKHQAEYLVLLCTLARQKKADAREVYKDKIAKMQAKFGGKGLELEQSEYFEKWYLPALREMVEFKEWTGNVIQMANWFSTKVSPEQFRRGLEILVRLQLIKPLSSGRYKQTSAIVHTDSAAADAAVIRFQKQMFRIGEAAFRQMKTDKREMTTLTFSYTKEKFDRIQEIMRECQERIAREASAETSSHNAVYQLNLQCFPLAAVAPMRPNRKKGKKS